MFLSAALIFSAAGCGSSQNFDTQIFITGLTGKTQQEENAESAEGKLRVMASFYTMADFAEKIGGDRADITCMVPAGTEPHDWEQRMPEKQDGRDFMRNCEKRAAAMFLSAALIFSAAGCGSSQNFDTQIFITGLTGKTQQEENAESAEGKLRVMASFYTMADFAEKIGGDRADITCMVPAGTEPHDWEPSTTQRRISPGWSVRTSLFITEREWSTGRRM